MKKLFNALRASRAFENKRGSSKNNSQEKTYYSFIITSSTCGEILLRTVVFISIVKGYR